MPYRNPGRWTIAALALLALPLAGCTAPAPVSPSADAPAAPEGASGHDPLRPAVAGAASEGSPTSPTPKGLVAPSAREEGPLACADEVRREEEWQKGQFILRVDGCVRGVVALPQISQREQRPVTVGEINETFSVSPEASRLVVLLHLHGDEKLRTALRGPGGALLFLDEIDGGTEDSYIRYEIPDPNPGTWRIEGYVWETTLVREWSLVVVADFDAPA